MNDAASTTKPFRHAMVFSGGGFRFGYYLGMHAAASECGRQPDAIFAACGGAIAAGIVACFQDDESRKQALVSQETYRMYRRIQVQSQVRLWPTLTAAIGRFCSASIPCSAANLAQFALFNIEDENDTPLFPFQGDYAGKQNIAIIGAEVLASSQTGKAQTHAPSFAEAILCSPKLAMALGNFPYQPPSPRISETLRLETSIPLATAIRISIGDIGYLAPFSHHHTSYIGGMLNLIPHHYARHCAKQITLELKQPFSPFTAVPVFKKYLGFDPNRRLREWHDSAVDNWCDTSDSHRVLKDDQIRKKLAWRANRLLVEAPPSYDAFQKMMLAQWQYGYQRGLACYRSPKNIRTRMRNANRLNTSTQFRQLMER